MNNEFISVKEMLPAKNTTLLILGIYGERFNFETIDLADYDAETQTFECSNWKLDSPIRKVTHWKYLK